MGADNKRKPRPEPKPLPVVVGQGRPTTYTREIADLICEQLSEGGLLTEICAQPPDGWLGYWPKRLTVLEWDRSNLDGFSNRYAQAREDGVQAELDHLRRISRDIRLGAVVVEKEVLSRDGTIVKVIEKRVGDMTQARALEADALKWRISKMAWRKYGVAPGVEKSEVPAEGDGDRKIVIEGGLPDDQGPVE